MSERKMRGFKIHQRQKSVFVGGSTRPALLCNSRSKQKLCLFTGQLHRADLSWSWGWWGGRTSISADSGSVQQKSPLALRVGLTLLFLPLLPTFYNLLTSLNPPSLFCISLFLPSFVLSGCVSGSVSIHDSIMTNCSECELDFAPNKSLNQIKSIHTSLPFLHSVSLLDVVLSGLSLYFDLFYFIILLFSTVLVVFSTLTVSLSTYPPVKWWCIDHLIMLFLCWLRLSVLHCYVFFIDFGSSIYLSGSGLPGQHRYSDLSSCHRLLWGRLIHLSWILFTLQRKLISAVWSWE